jgi:hypothetical protein
MIRPRWFLILTGISLLTLCTLLAGMAAEDPPAEAAQFAVSHAECSYFGSQRDRYAAAALRGAQAARAGSTLSARTAQVTAMLAPVPAGSRTYTFDRTHNAGTIDSLIEADFHANNITPAAATTDWEFIRRATLDLTGRIPAPDRVLSFVADTTAGKRAALVDELLNKPEWVDKWTMYFGDLYQNIDSKPSTSLRRYPQGRNAFYQWIHDSLAANKPYNQMATELISAATANTYDNGPSNYMLNAYITGGPNQDLMDQGTAFVFDTFLGISHVNCLLCHNGRGHLDSLSLWGSQTTRYQAWQLASYLSHTRIARVANSSAPNGLYWVVQDNVPGFTADYTLNTTTGNRPARVAPSGCKAGQPCYYVPPQYIFTGDAPAAGQNYRVSLARSITSDFQFARATVNYIWKEFFGRGIVDPVDTFDPARLDPDNPPPAPWTLQPSNARLLNLLAMHFANSGYDLRALMREITASDTYQLSSRYSGAWNPAWEPYFARKLVRRLWAEEVHDAVVQSSGTLPSYIITGFTDMGFAKPSFAMQFPDVAAVRDGNANVFLDSFLRGNRDDQPRKQDGSILQALSLMNNPVVVSRVKAAGATGSQLIMQNLNKSNTDLVNTLFLNILSRYPTSDEMAKSMAAMPASGTARTAAVQDLVWSLYNKVDFVFNY